MTELVRTRNEQRLFALLVGAAFLLLVIVRVVLILTLDPDREVAKFVLSVMDNLVAAVIGAAVAFGLFLYLRRDIESPDSVKLVAEAKGYFAEALGKASKWWHNGHYGSWTRGNAMPALAHNTTGGGKSIQLIILDPRNKNLCDSYTSFRQGEAVRMLEGPWLPWRTYAEIYATILAAQRWSVATPPLPVSVFLKNHYSTYRYDINDLWGIITQIDPRNPPLVVARESSWYSALDADFQRQKASATELKLLRRDELESLGLDSLGDPNVVSRLMSHLRVPIPTADPGQIAREAIARWDQGPDIYK